MNAHNLGPPNEGAGPPREDRPDLNTPTVTAESPGVPSVTQQADNPADPERTRRAVDLLRYGRTEHVIGCPAGCGSFHECGVDEPIDGLVDYLDSAVFVLRDGAPALTDLRHSGAVAA